MVAQLDELLADDNLKGENRYLVFKARRALHKQRSGLKPLDFSDSLFLAASEHCNDGTNNGIVGDVGSDGLFPSERVQKYAKSMGVEEQVDAAPLLDSVDKAVQRAVVNMDLTQIFNPHAKFGAIATCAHKTQGGFLVSVTAESVVPSKATLQKVEDLIKQAKVIVGTEGPERALIQLSEDLAFWSGKQRSAIQAGEGQDKLDEYNWRIDSIVALMRVERQKIEDAKRNAMRKQMQAEAKAIKIAQIEKKIKLEQAVQKQAEDILARLERGLDRYIRQPSGNSEQALNLYTDNIRAFV